LEAFSFGYRGSLYSRILSEEHDNVESFLQLYEGKVEISALASACGVPAILRVPVKRRRALLADNPIPGIIGRNRRRKPLESETLANAEARRGGMIYG
jgi:hypothetical protein